VRSRMPPVRSRISGDDPDADVPGPPTSTRRDGSGQPRLSIESPEHLVDVDEFGLEFDQQKVARGGVPGHLIDAPSLAVDRERHFRCRHPTRGRRHEGSEALGEMRMPGVQQAFGVAPRQWAVNSRRTSTPAAMARIVSSDNFRQWPRSSSETVACETPAAAARSV
jgi:hypothetical protein